MDLDLLCKITQNKNDKSISCQEQPYRRTDKARNRANGGKSSQGLTVNGILISEIS